MRTNSDENNKDEYVVEKIISKRFNPRKKTFEYLIKWENFDKYVTAFICYCYITQNLYR